jgi:hypothetical protein
LEDRISRLRDKINIYEKAETSLSKRIKRCERNMQEFCDYIQRPNLQIIGIEEREEVQAKCIHDIFNKIIGENFPNLEKVMPIQV